MVLLLALHIVAAVIWVGGMAFAYLVLRPSAGPLEPPLRLGLWRRVFGRFLPLVWASVIALLASGYGMAFGFLGGVRGAGLHVHIMQGTGILMMMLFFHLFFAPWKRFGRALDGGALPEAARNLDQIRVIVLINLVLGLVTVVVGATGRYW
jgi:uncharacterized membrane protein